MYYKHTCTFICRNDGKIIIIRNKNINTYTTDFLQQNGNLTSTGTNMKLFKIWHFLILSCKKLQGREKYFRQKLYFDQGPYLVVLWFQLLQHALTLQTSLLMAPAVHLFYLVYGMLSTISIFIENKNWNKLSIQKKCWDLYNVWRMYCLKR